MLHAMNYRRQIIKSHSFDADVNRGDRASESHHQRHQRHARSVFKNSSFEYVRSVKAAKPMSPTLSSSSSLLRVPSVKEYYGSRKQSASPSFSKKKKGKSWNLFNALFRTTS